MIHNQYITSFFIKNFRMSALNEIIAIDNISESLVNVGLFVFTRYIKKGANGSFFYLRAITFFTASTISGVSR